MLKIFTIAKFNVTNLNKILKKIMKKKFKNSMPVDKWLPWKHHMYLKDICHIKIFPD